MLKIEFVEDKEFKYSEDIKKGLKTYNQSQAGYKEKDKQNFYVFEDNDVLGVCHTKMASDWCHIESVYYDNIEVLKTLINDIKKYYKNRVEGIQFNSVIASRVKDFKALDFIERGKLENMPKGKDNIFLINTDFETHEAEEDYQIKSSDKKIESLDKVMKNENRKLRRSLDFSSEIIDIQFVALIDGEFAGGVYGNFQYDYLFINILYVDKEHRGRQIATKLMDLIESKAREKEVYNLYLTTFEFQALGLYQKLGYETVMVIDDYPIGFKEYTIYKKLTI